MTHLLKMLCPVLTLILISSGCGGSSDGQTSFRIDELETPGHVWSVEWDETKTGLPSVGGIHNTKAISGTLNWRHAGSEGSDNFIGGVYKNTDLAAIGVDPTCGGQITMFFDERNFRHLALSPNLPPGTPLYQFHLFIPTGKGTLQGVYCEVDTDGSYNEITVTVK